MGVLNERGAPLKSLVVRSCRVWNYGYDLERDVKELVPAVVWDDVTVMGSGGSDDGGTESEFEEEFHGCM